MLELSSCEYSDYYYVEYLMKIDQVKNLHLNIDRGCDFPTLAYILESFELDSLILEQNYSNNSFNDLVYFINTLKLKNFTLIDFQSELMKSLTLNELVKIVPDDCNYTFKYGEYDQYIKYKNMNRKITMIGKYE